MSMNRDVNRRQVLLGAGALAGLGVLAACGSPASSNAGSLAQPKGNVPEQYAKRTRVVFWSHFGGEPQKALTKLVNAFNAAQSDIYVENQVQTGNYDSLAQKLATTLQAKQTPELAIFSEVTWHKFFLNDALEPLDDYFTDGFTTTGYNQKLLGEGRLADKLWWVPFGRSTPLFYYNRDLFAQAGLPDRAPNTWSELRDWSEAMKGQKFNGNTPRMFAFPKNDGDWMFQGVLWNFGGAVSDGLDIKIDTPESIAAAEYERKLVHEQKQAYMAEDLTLEFTNGLAASVENSTGSLRGITEGAKFEFAAAFVPGEKSQAVTTGGAGLSIMKGAETSRKKAAFEFVKFLARPENAAAWTIATGYLPAVDAAVEEPALATLLSKNPNFKVAIDQLPTTKIADAARLFVPNANITIYKGLQRIWTRNEDSAAVMKSVAEELRKSADGVRASYEKHVGAA
jgi:sn-glycerol 3-phosphate transport system substrate-binding protein